MANYLHWKVWHLVFVISWMVGLLYLPRLFVYHAQSTLHSDRWVVFCTMERRLLRGIMLPAMVGAFVFGGLLIASSGPMIWTQKWLHWKLGLVLLLAAYHGMCVRFHKDFVAGENKKSHKFFRFFNEVPALVMVFVIFLVVFKPV
jgi:putative membrane protein